MRLHRRAGLRFQGQPAHSIDAPVTAPGVQSEMSAKGDVSKLYVGNLGYGVGDEELGHLFGGYGVVMSAVVIRHHNNQGTAGFGYVEMETAAQSLAAVAGLDGRGYGGHVLTVDWTSSEEGLCR
jgi:RNA recognition motif-containing protein